MPWRNVYHYPFHSQGWSISNFPCSLSRNITSHSMENLAFHSLLRLKMIITPILTTSLIHFSLERLGECAFWTWEWKGYTRTSARGWRRERERKKIVQPSNFLALYQHFPLVSPSCTRVQISRDPLCVSFHSNKNIQGCEQSKTWSNIALQKNNAEMWSWECGKLKKREAGLDSY